MSSVQTLESSSISSMKSRILDLRSRRDHSWRVVWGSTAVFPFDKETIGKIIMVSMMVLPQETDYLRLGDSGALKKPIVPARDPRNDRFFLSNVRQTVPPIPISGTGVNGVAKKKRGFTPLFFPYRLRLIVLVCLGTIVPFSNTKRVFTRLVDRFL